MVSTNIVFLSSARYSQPLDATTEKKFRALKTLGGLFVVGFSKDLRPREFTEHARFYLLPKLPLPILRYTEMFMIGPFLLLWLVLRHGVHVLVAQSPYEGFTAALAKNIARWLGYDVVLVVESHGDFEGSLFMQRRIALQVLHRFVMRHTAHFAVKHADALRAVSGSTKEQLERWAPEKTVCQFPAWTDIETFLRSARHSKQDFRQAILYAGVLTPLKGIHHLINAFVITAGDFPSVQLLIVGKDENKTYVAELRKQIQKLGLDGRVRFMEAMPQSELAMTMAEASVLVLPSTSEGLGRVIIEAMATGTPVIGSRVGGIPELIEDGERGFLVPPGNEPALAGKLNWILNNPEKARAMGECARVFAEQLFSTDSYLRGYKQIFDMAQSRSKVREHAPSTL